MVNIILLLIYKEVKIYYIKSKSMVWVENGV